MARVSTYLNFSNYTEEAFNYYRSIFGTEFTEPGIQRMDSIPPQDGQPPMSDEMKNLVLHVELPITGGHLLMGTDAPEQMGFAMNYGNNMHIMLEPDTKEESKKLFDSLAEGGKVTMALQEMFWGAYFGSCVDKYGVQWMVNFSTK